MEPIEEKNLNLESELNNTFQAEPINKEVSFKIEKESSIEQVAAEKDDAYSKIISKISDSQASDDEGLISADARDVSMGKDAESQIQHLVDIASAKGVVHAVKVAKHMEDNYVLDTFHDKLLSDELNSALVQRGMIKED